MIQIDTSVSYKLEDETNITMKMEMSNNHIGINHKQSTYHCNQPTEISKGAKHMFWRTNRHRFSFILDDVV